MELADGLAFARTTSKGTLVTLRRDGRPQLSNILYAVGDDDVVRISITADRVKYRNLLRDPWSALHVSRHDFFAYAVLEGAAELSAVAGRVDDETVAELVELYRAVSGEHDDWEAYRQAMVEDGRVVVRFRPTRVYGMI